MKEKNSEVCNHFKVGQARSDHKRWNELVLLINLAPRGKVHLGILERAVCSTAPSSGTFNGLAFFIKGEEDSALSSGWLFNKQWQIISFHRL